MNNYKGKRLNRWVKTLIALVCVGVVAFSALLGAVLYGSYDHVKGDPQIMVILGCQVKPWGPSILLQDRLDKALDYWDDNPDITIVVSGGQGADEHISEAQAMYDYLVENGVDEGQIIQEDQSYNTLQNLTCTMQMLEEKGYDTTGEIVVVSNGFHLTRVRMLWERVFGSDDNLSTLAAPATHVPSRLKMYIREPLALVKSFIFDR